MIAMRSAAFPVLCLLALAAPRAAQDNEKAKKLFLTNCATCHGESGDGKGTTQLDRPARSFMDGGFSFGNTPEQLFRTISTGIPGTPMPGFDASLTEDDRKLVASYVVTLGPPIEEVKVEDMILSVHDRPLIVRGKLPALAEGLPEHPRGLLIGDSSGITFEYRVDDVRLLALRQGGFVERTDWSGRGGTALSPLGKVVHLVEGGKPEPMFFSHGRALEARLSGTRVGEYATIQYHLVGSGGELAHATESPIVLTTPFGTGYQRVIGFVPAVAVELNVRTPALEGATVLASGERKCERWQVVRAADGLPVYSFMDAPGGTVRSVARGQLEATIAAKPGAKNVGVIVQTLVLVDWNKSIEKQLRRWYEEM